MRFITLPFVLAATLLAAGPPLDDARDAPSRVRGAQYRTLNDRFEPPRFTSAEAWAPRAKYIREHILVSAGLMPLPERTPLRPVVFGDVAHADYIVSKVYFESLPGFFVTGNLYRPVGAGPFPAILSPHGHWQYGRLENTALNSGPGRAIGLARQGFVVFAHDMVGYNDSRQLPHTFGGRRESLWGLNLSGLQLWNAMRGLDFLETLPYVRKDGFGVTGESGGGTQTFLLAAVDPRVSVAVPVNMISLHMQGGCLCENMPGLRHDINNVEIAATIAPRPLLMVSATGDWTAETMEREFPAVRSAYALFGAEAKVHAVKFTAEHNYNKDSREAMYAWMARWMQNATADARRPERGFSADSPADLMVFHGRTMPDGALTPAEFTERWIASAKAQLAAGDRAALQTSLRHALGFAETPLAAAAPSAKPARRVAVVASTTPEVDAALRQAGFEIRPVTFTAFDEPSAAKVRHFDTYNRTAASQRVADIVAALRQSPSAVLVADGDAALPALFAAAIAPVPLTVANVGGFDTSSDEQFLQRMDIAGLRRAGDFQTAAGMANGAVVVHGAADAFKAPGMRIEREALTPRAIAALAVK